MTTIYKDADADLRALAGRRLAVIGYGNQGRAQALNLRDSGIRDLVIGSDKPSADHPAHRDGFTVCRVAEAVQQADIVFLLVPDEVMPAVYRESVEPHLKAGTTLVFASGYNITFNRIQPPPSVDVVMLAPRMIGEGVRERFTRQEGYPAFVAVHQDATGRALPTVLALAKGIGATRQGAIAATFKDETMLDLLAEQAIWPLILAVMTEAFKLQTEKGHPVEASLIELYLSREPAYMLEKMAEIGLFRQMPFHSHTSQYGQLSRLETLDRTFIRHTLEQAYAHIESGRFAEEWTREQAAGMPEYRRLIRQALESEISRLEVPLLAGPASPGTESDTGAITLEGAVISEQQVRAAVRQEVRTLRIAPDALLTPSARDAVREHQVTVVRSGRS